MKKGIVIWLVFLLVIQKLSAQKTETSQNNAGAAQSSAFYNFEIPAVINGSNIDPSPISNLSSNFTDSKLSLKIGIPSFFHNVAVSNNLRLTGFFQPYVKATNGVSTLWSANSKPSEFGFSSGMSYKFAHRYWNFTAPAGLAGRRSSEEVYWVNLLGNLEWGNYNLFNDTASYGKILNKQRENSSGILITLNHYFYSDMNKFRVLSNIWSLGVGYAKTNNYSSLKSKTLQEGKIVYDGNGNSQSVVETTSGRSGVLEVYEGLTATGEIYIPLVRDRSFGGFWFGNRLTYYGIGKNKKIVNGNTGFYFNLKDKNPGAENAAKDVANFSITADFKQLNKSNEKDYFKNNFSILFQAAIPLRFN